MMMRSAILHAPNTPLTIETFPIPEPGIGQVLVKMVATGVCHTQLHEIRGNRGDDPYLPHFLGHEGAGVVVSVGAGVKKVTPGEHVIVSWIKGIGLDAGGAKYDLRGKVVNSGPVATFTEYTLAPENRVTAIRKDMPLDVAAIIGCAVATGAGIVYNTARLKPGETIAVFGVGGIGMSAVYAASVLGAAKIIAVDVIPEKLARVRELGATDVIDARRSDPVQVIAELTKGLGVDYAVEAIGIPKTMEQAHASVRAGGGVAILAGNVVYGQRMSVDPFDLIRGRQLVGTWGGETRPDADFPRYVDLCLAGKLRLQELISHRYQFEQINEAFLALSQGKAVRAILTF